MDRRETLKTFALVPLATMLGWSTPITERIRPVPPIDDKAHQHPAGIPYTYAEAPQFFTDHEFGTVRVLSDWIIPADDRSGSATDAHVPEFIDYTMIDQPWRQTPIRGGLAWLDTECRMRFGSSFAKCSHAQQQEMLDVIAYPSRAPESMRHGVTFFNKFRDLVASGFWTSKIGIEDIYRGNEYVSEWTGCPEEVHKVIHTG